MDIDRLVGPDHLVRAIWELAGRMDLEKFLDGNKSVEGRAGRERFDPRLLFSVWVYGYSQGIGSARELARQQESASRRELERTRQLEREQRRLADQRARAVQSLAGGAANIRSGVGRTATVGAAGAAALG